MTDFTEIQQAFANHIRDPENAAMPEGIENRRMKIYRDLFFNNVLGFITSGFPVLNSLYNEEDWQRLARKFFIQHQCESPIFLDISEAFVEFLANEYQPTAIDPPFLVELAHYEWVELVISIKQELADYPCIDIEQAKEQPLVIAETAWPLHYQYPVHQISNEYQPQQPTTEGTGLVVYRNKELDVDFMLVNPATIQLLGLIQANPGCLYQDILQTVQQSMPQFTQEQIESGFEQTLSGLLARGIVRQYCS
ncbi:DUF2063 domain-containing protein [Saccharobesus litoralis]|uniref:DUF2063 domain-containing protein n=1 Tax=Saccharobesus litoralis TaxID=2172099 RepID=A0A2S0VV14_9ALTE|nr:putative DNA-binding domain-containing protein [Saccharobesus litoralis]AWB68048.1 DUF2063 domain-containing protein [Saccharobesus litoralis]